MATRDQDSRFRVVRWMLRNKFRHIQIFMEPVLESGHVPDRLKERILRRVRNAHRLVKVRAAIYALLVFAALGSAVIGFTEAVATEYSVFVRALVVLVSLFSATLGVVSLALVNRTLGILEAEIYVLSMHAMSRHVHEGGVEEPKSATAKGAA